MSNPPYGPENPHPLSRMKTELVWEGKYDEYGRKREVALPSFPLVMQKIETIDEPRDRSKAQGSLFDEEKAHRDDFRNLLIWGDNKLGLASLLSKFRGRVKLIYIDPPFDVGADFTMNVQIGDNEEVEKIQSVIEAVAYRDTWGQGTDSYVSMLYDRITLAASLLAEDGSFFLHCDGRVEGIVRALLDEVFGKDNYRNSISWIRSASHNDAAGQFGKVKDTIFYYGKSSQAKLNKLYTPYTAKYIGAEWNQLPNGRFWKCENMLDPQNKMQPYDFHGTTARWRTTPEKFEALWNAPATEVPNSHGRIKLGKDGKPTKRCRIVFLDELPGVPLKDVWDDISYIAGGANESVNYRTQKPEALLERIITSSTDSDDLVLDFFCGSGTTLAVAERLGRKWIGCDLGRYAIHTSRKRLISAQRRLFAEDKQYRSFDLFNLGRYERQWWQQDRLKGANEEHRATVLKFFRAQPLHSSSSPLLHGTKMGAYVHVDDIDSLLTYEELNEVAKAVQAAGGKSVICLAWEFQMDLKMRAQALESELGIDIRLTYIPREIMEPNRNEVQFFDAAALEAEALTTVNGKEKKVDVKLTRFIPSLTEVPEKELEALRERAVRSPFDFIDFWAVDFEHREGKPFEHHWQDYRTRKDRALLTQSTCGWEYETPGKKSICLKVIDVFGIDTTKVIEVTV